MGAITKFYAMTVVSHTILISTFANHTQYNQ